MCTDLGLFMVEAAPSAVTEWIISVCLAYTDRNVRCRHMRGKVDNHFPIHLQCFETVDLIPLPGWLPEAKTAGLLRLSETRNVHVRAQVQGRARARGATGGQGYIFVFPIISTIGTKWSSLLYYTF